MEPDVKLLFGVLGGGSISGESGKRIAEELSSIVKEINDKGILNLKVKVDLDDDSATTLQKGIQDAFDKLNSNKKGFVVNLTKIDTKSAVAGLKKDIQAVLNSLSIRSGMEISMKTDIGDIASNIKKETKEIKSDFDEAANRAAKFKAQMDSLSDQNSGLRQNVKSSTKAAAGLGLQDDVDALNERYRRFAELFELIKNKQILLTEDQIDVINDERYAIEEQSRDVQEAAKAAIQAKQEQKDAAKDAANEEKKAAAERERAAKKEETDRQKILRLYDQAIKYKKQNTKIEGTGLGNRLDSIITTLEQLKSGAIDIGEVDISNLLKQFTQLKGDVHAAGLSGKSLLSIIKEGYAKYGGWSLITKSMSSAWRQCVKMLHTIIDIDTAMTELKKVTNETGDSYTRFLDEASSRAKTLGATITDTVSASADFARLGYGLDDAAALADAALIYKNVGDGITDINEASEPVIATMKAFKIEAKDVMTIVDKFNITGNNFAITSAGIGDALLNSAAALDAAGNSLDESIALITASNNVVQDPQKVGTTLKTISMYLRAAKTEAEEAGESTDGMADSISELRKEILALTGGKVDIQVDEDTFKNTYQILKELSVVWSSLTDVSQANLLEMLGGKRNSNVVAALLNDFSTAEKVIEKTANSTGSALEENEKYLDSINGRTALFKAAFEDLAQTVINSDLVKRLIDAGTSGLELLDNIIERFGTITTLITTLGAGFGASNISSVLSPFIVSKNSIGTAIVTPQIADDIQHLKNYRAQIAGIQNDAEKAGEIFNATMSGASSYAQTLAQSADLATMSTWDMTKALTRQAAAATAAKVASIALNAAWSMLASVVLTALIKKFDEWLHRFEIAAKHASEDAVSYNSTNDDISSYISKIDDLKTALDSSTISQEDAYNARKQLLQIQSEIIKVYGNEIGQLDLLRMSAEESADALSRIPASMAGRFLTENQSAINDSIAAMEETRGYMLGNFVVTEDERAIANRVKDLLKKYDGVFYEEFTEVNGELAKKFYINIDDTDAITARDTINSLAKDFRDLQTTMSKQGHDINSILPEGETFSKWFEDGIANVNKVLDKYSDIYNQAVVWKIADNSSYTETMESIVSLQEKYNDTLATTYDSEANRSTAIEGIVTEYNNILNLINSDNFFDKDDLGVRRYFEEQLEELKKAKEKFEAELRLENEFRQYLDEVENAKRNSEGDIIDGELVGDIEAVNAAREKFIATARQAGMTEEEIALVFRDSKLALDNLGGSIKGVTTDTLTLNEALSSLSTIQGEIDKLSEALGEFYENKEISAETAAGLTETFGGLQGFDDFIATITDSSSSFSDVQNALNVLGAQYVENTGILSKLNEENKDATAHFLKQIGVVNADQVVMVHLANNQVEAAIASGELTDKTWESIEAFLTKAGASAAVIDGLQKLRTAEYEAMLESIDFTEATSKEIDKLIELAAIVGLSTEKITKLNAAKRLSLLAEKGLLPDEADYEALMSQLQSGASTDTDYTVKVEVDVDMPKDLKSKAEDAFEKLQKEFSKIIANYEHNIFLGEKNRADYTAIIAIYKEMQDAVHAQAEKYRAMGVDENSDYIQALQKQWWEYEDSITQLREDHFEKLSNSIQEIVDKTNEALDGFQDFYSTITDAAKEYASTGYLSANSLQSILELGPKYLTFLQDENGQLVLNEEALQNVIAAKTEEMAVETAMAFAKNVLIAAQNDDIKTLEELTQVNIAATNSTWDMVYATLELAKVTGIAKGHSAAYYDDALREARNIQALAKTTVSSIQEYYKTLNEGYVSQADGLQTILEMTQEMIQWENDQKIETLEKEKELFGDIVDAQRESLELAKEQDDHNKSVAEKLEKIARLQDNIDMLKLDDSREASAQRSQLEQELNELQKELADEQADYAYELQVDTLEKQQQAFEDSKDEEIEALESTLDSAEELYQAAIKRIDAGWDDLYEDLLSWNYEYGSTLEKDLVTAWDAATAAVQRYGSFVEALEGVQSYTNLGSGYADGSGVSSGVAMTDQMTDIYNKMKQNSFNWFLAGDKSKQADLSAENADLAKDWEALTGQALTPKDFSWYLSDGSLFYSLDKNDVAKAVVSEMESNAAKWKIADQQGDSAKKNILSAKNSQMAADLAYYLNRRIENIGGTWYIDGRPLFDEFDRYHTGGIVGGKGTLKQNEVMAVLEEGEIILDEGKEKVFYRFVDFAQMMSEKLGKAFDNTSFKNAFSGQNRMPALVSNAIPETTNNMNFNPIVNVNIQHSGNLDDSDAKRFGSIAANSVLSELTDAFSRRGISNMGSAFLK